MEDLGRILADSITGGAAAVAKGVASDAIRLAYESVKRLVGPKLSVWKQIEEGPCNSAFHKISEDQLAQHSAEFSNDPHFIEQLQVLQNALATLRADRAQDAGIDIARIRAGRDAVIRALNAKGHVEIRDVAAAQDVVLENIRSVSTQKKK